MTFNALWSPRLKKSHFRNIMVFTTDDSVRMKKKAVSDPTFEINRWAIRHRMKPPAFPFACLTNAMHRFRKV